jgi:hypothetical protein
VSDELIWITAFLSAKLMMANIDLKYQPGLSLLSFLKMDDQK